MKKIILVLLAWTGFNSAHANDLIKTIDNPIEIAKIIQVIRFETFTKVTSCPITDDQVDLIAATAAGFIVDKIEILRGRTPDRQIVNLTYRPESLKGFACQIDKKSKLFQTAPSRK